MALDFTNSTGGLNIFGVYPERFLAIGISALLVQQSSRRFNGRGVTPLNPKGSTTNQATLRRLRDSVGLSRILLTIVLLRVLRVPENTSRTVEGLIGGGGLVFDGKSQILKALRVMATLGCLAVQFTNSSTTDKTSKSPEYPLLRLLALLGGRLLVSADDLRVFYLALELQSLSLYVLAASARGSAYSTEAGLKYFRLGAFASGLFLLGASLVYGYLGTTNYADIGLLTHSMDLTVGGTGRLKVGFALRVAAVRFKLGAVPFHRWSPDVFEGSPATSSRFFASVTKIAAFGALVRLGYGPFYDLWSNRISAIAIRSGLSRVVAALAALGQRRRKRFLAYSGIGHRGFRLRGLACRTPAGLQASRTYLTVYAIGSIGVWAAVVASGAQYFTDLGGLARRQPALARVFAVSRFSRAGVPPRAGFFAKLSVFFAAREGSAYRLATIAVLASVVGAFYYLRIVKIRYFEPITPGQSVRSDISTGAAWTRTISTFITRFLLVNPTLPVALAKYRTTG